ncbi:MAG: hypothetical protein ACRBCL_16800 [Maritimibacter sp.]
MLYPIVLTLHLFCAILFVGSVFFEVFVLPGVKTAMGDETMEHVEAAVFERARRVMPFIVVALFGTGLTLLTLNWQLVDLSAPSRFTLALAVKVIAAFSVLGHFIYALTCARRGGMSAAASKRFHLSLIAHMTLIVVLAKVMFYI